MSKRHLSIVRSNNVRKEASMRKNSRMRWLASDFDGRAESEDSPELMGNFSFLDKLGALDRMDEESADVFVVRRDVIDPVIREQWAQEDDEAGFSILRDDDEIRAATLNVVVKRIVRRPAENIAFLDPAELDDDAVLNHIKNLEDATEGNRFTNMSLEQLIATQDDDSPDPTDALAYADTLGEVTGETDEESDMLDDVRASLEVRAPKDKWDLVIDESDPDPENWYSADWYPTRADKSLRGYAAKLAKAIDKGMSRKALFNALREANPVSAAKEDAKAKLAAAAKTKTAAELEELQKKWNAYLKLLEIKKHDRVPPVQAKKLWEAITERDEVSNFVADPVRYQKRIRNKIRSIKEQSK